MLAGWGYMGGRTQRPIVNAGARTTEGRSSVIAVGNPNFVPEFEISGVVAW
jgi:hypothetical protein